MYANKPHQHSSAFISLHQPSSAFISLHQPSSAFITLHRLRRPASEPPVTGRDRAVIR
jgi:hypothetical protein